MSFKITFMFTIKIYIGYLLIKLTVVIHFEADVYSFVIEIYVKVFGADVGLNY